MEIIKYITEQMKNEMEIVHKEFVYPFDVVLMDAYALYGNPTDEPTIQVIKNLREIYTGQRKFGYV